jgi:hypothetical protein
MLMRESCCEETRRVSTEVVAISFSLPLLDALKRPDRIRDSLFDLTTFKESPMPNS